MKNNKVKMNSLNSQLSAALNWHRQGDFAKAETMYRSILNHYPAHASTLNLLGLIYYQKKNYLEALQWIEKAIGQQKKNPDFFNNLGTVLKELGRWDEALEAYMKAVAMMPDDVDILYNLGGLYLRMQKLEQAAQYYKKAINIQKNYFSAYANLTSILNDLGLFNDSVTYGRQAVGLGAEDGAIYNNLGNAYLGLKQFDRAIDTFKLSIAIDPNSSVVYVNLGNALQNFSNLKACECYRKAIELDPTNYKAHNCLGTVSRKLGRLQDALHCYQAAIRIRPSDAIPYHNMGNIYIDLGRNAEAIKCLTKALEFNPDLVETHISMGIALKDSGNQIEAQKFFNTAIKLRPDNAKPYCYLINSYQHDCNWPMLKKYNEVLDALTERALDAGQVPDEKPFLNFIRRAEPALNFRVAKANGDHIATQVIEIRKKIAKIERIGSIEKGHSSKIAIGYLSNNFKNHPTAHLLAGMFRLHDRQRFTVICYSYGKNDDSDYRRRIEADCDRFVDIELVDHASAVELMIRDRLDILVDLVGFLKNNRIEIAALRPAPVQVRWLGMAGTCGADCFDYIITDEIVTPRDQSQYYSETFCYMPHTYQINSAIQSEPLIATSRESVGLPPTGFVFCSFCSTYKIDQTIFDAWMRILIKVPDGILWMLSPSQTAQKEIKAYATEFGVDPDRIVFAAKTDRKNHLARLSCADLGLDTLIVNGAATTSEALWCGVPVLTVQGKHFASRMASSLLTAIGLQEMVAESLDEYVQKAVDIALDRAYYQALKDRLAVNKTSMPLFDCERFVRNLEDRFEQMWRCHESNGEKRIIGGRNQEKGFLGD